MCDSQKKRNGNARDCIFWIRVDKKSPLTWTQQFFIYEFITGSYPVVFIACRKYWFIPKVFKAEHVQETLHIARDRIIWIWLEPMALLEVKILKAYPCLMSHSELCLLCCGSSWSCKINPVTAFVWVKTSLLIFLARQFSWSWNMEISNKKEQEPS